MEHFSVYSYNNLPEVYKSLFCDALSKRLFLLKDKIKKDDVLCSLDMSESGNTVETLSNNTVELYSRVSSGIQSGSGNQPLFLDILNAFVEAWAEIHNNQR